MRPAATPLLVVVECGSHRRHDAVTTDQKRASTIARRRLVGDERNNHGAAFSSLFAPSTKFAIGVSGETSFLSPSICLTERDSLASCHWQNCSRRECAYGLCHNYPRFLPSIKLRDWLSARTLRSLEQFDRRTQRNMITDSRRMTVLPCDPADAALALEGARRCPGERGN